MYILTNNNDIYEINKTTKHTINDIYYGVLDIDDQEEPDYYFKKLQTFQSYEYPVAELSIGNYLISLPLNWKILVSYSDSDETELVSIEELINFDYNVFVYNPFKDMLYKELPVRIHNVYNSNVKWFIPKLNSRNLLILPLGYKNEWVNREKCINGKLVSERYPECIMVADETEKYHKNINISSIL